MKKIIFILFLLSKSNLFAQSLTLTSGTNGTLQLSQFTFEQISAIPNPVQGSVVYDLTSKCIRFYNGTKWQASHQNSSDFNPVVASVFQIPDNPASSSFQITKVVADNDGNIYGMGVFQNTITINSNNYTSSGFSDIFIVKLNSLGAVQWVKTGGFANTQAFGQNLVLDNNGFLYFGGIYYNSFSFGGNTVNANNNSTDIFLGKISVNDGSLSFLKSIGGINYDVLSDMTIDNNGDLFMTGTFLGIMNFDGFTINGTDANDIFLSKFNSTGSAIWLSKITGTANDEGRSLAVDNLGNIYLAGQIASNATFDNTNINTFGVNRFFIAKYNSSNGTLIWVRTPSGTGTNYAHRVVCDNAGNAYVGIIFNGSISFGNFSFFGNADIFIAKINTNGDWVWYQASMSGSNETETFGDLKINAQNEIYATVYTGFQSINYGFSDKRYNGNNFLFKFSSNGRVIGGKTFQSGLNNYLKSIHIKNNIVYLGGYTLAGSVYFDNFTITGNNNLGYLCKIVE